MERDKVYVVRFMFDDGTTEDYHETDNADEAYRIADSMGEMHPEFEPVVITLGR